MDQKKIGRFLAQLRKEKNLTQEALGQKLGVTNKTISRWENGNYMPDIEMLKLLSEEFDVSMNELVSGERISAEEFVKTADANLAEALQNSSFTAKERMDFWKKKWRKEQFAVMAICVLILLAVLIAALIKRWSVLVAVMPVVVLIVYAILRNREMIYAKTRVYGATSVAEEKSKLQ